MTKLSYGAGISGLAVTYGLNLNILIAWCMWNLCNVETKIISVERIQQYTRIESEAPLVIEDKRPPPSWPSEGTIELQQLQVCFLNNALLAESCTSPSTVSLKILQFYADSL